MLTCNDCGYRASEDTVALFDYCSACKVSPFNERAEYAHTGFECGAL